MEFRVWEFRELGNLAQRSSRSEPPAVGGGLQCPYLVITARGTDFGDVSSLASAA